MIVTSVSDFRKDMKSYLDRVSKNFETLIINRGEGLWNRSHEFGRIQCTHGYSI